MTAFWLERLPSGVIITQDFPLDDWSWAQALNRAGTLSGRLPLTAELGEPTWLDPWRTAIYAVEGTQVRWGGILSPPTLGVGDQSLQINAFEWPGYFDRNDILVDRQFSDTEQFEIVETLVRDLQELDPDFELGIDVTWDAPSGVLRDREEAYRLFQAKNLGDAIRQLAAVRDGFDFAMTYTINPATNRIDKALKLYYPRKGRETGYTFEYERDAETNVVAHGFADPVDFAWLGNGWGEGSDATKLRSEYLDDTLVGIYPPFSTSPSFSSVSEQATLDANTEGFFERRRRPRRIPVTRVDATRYPRWGTYTLGDIMRVEIADGIASTSGRFRLTGWKVDADSPTVDLTWADPLGDDPAEDEVF